MVFTCQDLDDGKLISLSIITSKFCAVEKTEEYLFVSISTYLDNFNSI